MYSREKVCQRNGKWPDVFNTHTDTNTSLIHFHNKNIVLEDAIVGTGITVYTTDTTNSCVYYVCVVGRGPYLRPVSQIGSQGFLFPCAQSSAETPKTLRQEIIWLIKKRCWRWFEEKKKIIIHQVLWIKTFKDLRCIIIFSCWMKKKIMPVKKITLKIYIFCFNSFYLICNLLLAKIGEMLILN